MIEVENVAIISIDKSDSTWAIEGEIVFESDLTVSFSVDYDQEEDELVDMQLDINPGKYDKNLLKEMILNATMDYED